jgi:glycine/D-amino acid oxidase-like deaminating enzyme
VTERADVAVVGAGIVGLATTRALLRGSPGLRLTVIDKELRIAAHQTEHNSGVLHAFAVPLGQPTTDIVKSVFSDKPLASGAYSRAEVTRGSMNGADR